MLVRSRVAANIAVKAYQQSVGLNMCRYASSNAKKSPGVVIGKKSATGSASRFGKLDKKTALPSDEESRIHTEVPAKEVKKKKPEKQHAPATEEVAVDTESRSTNNKPNKVEKKKGKKKESGKTLPESIEMKHKSANEKKKAKRPTLTIPKFINLADLSGLLKIRLQNLQKQLEEMGFEDLSHDYIIDAETTGLIVEELGYKPIYESADTAPTTATNTSSQQAQSFGDIVPQDIPDNAPLRPPIVTIMGHVDHGKTTVLDYLRKSSVAAGEHGGITQHIGAFSVKLASGKEICFLDTPGHAAFLNMRQRGANVTDIVVLVVAADDSVMPQTKEAIKHAQKAAVPIIVAVNKVDRPDADVDNVVADLAANGVDVEPYGGETQVIPVSGLKGTGIDKLEEAIVTLSEIAEFKAPSEGKAEGWIIESEFKKGLGAVASVLVRRGTLSTGDFIVAGTKWCKVRNLTNDKGQRVKTAGPGIPVEVLGWKELPEAGDEVLTADSEQHAKKTIEGRLLRTEDEQRAKQIEIINQQRKQQRIEQEKEAERQERTRLGLPEEETNEKAINNSNETPTIDKLSFIVKADVSGSAEAVSDSIQGLGNESVAATVLYSGVGAVSESDVTRAEVANASILAFNIKAPKDVASLAARKNVEIINHTIIYRLLEDVTQRLSAQLKPEIKHKVLGEALIKDTFEISIKRAKNIQVAGVRVSNGVLSRKAKVKVFRNREEVYNGAFSSMKHHKEEVNEAKKDSECGLSFEGWTGFESGDVIQTYEEIVIPRYL